MTRLLRLAQVLAAAAALAFCGAHAQAPAPAAPSPPLVEPAAAPTGAPQAADDTVTLNFVNADITAVIKAVAEMTGRNFLIDPRVQGTVNIIAPRPVARSMVFPILLSALRVQGFAAVGGDLGVIHVVPESDAKFYGSARDPRRARGDQIVTEVFQLQYESAAQIVTVLRPLVAPNNVINAFPGSNTIVVTDYASNLERIRKVLGTVDQPAASELGTVKLRYAAAVDVGQAVQRLVPEASQAAGQGAAPRVALTVDARTNSLLVRADNPAVAKRIRELAASMDVPTAAGGNIHVVYLRNAEAARLAESLRAMRSGIMLACRI
jgi:general secretion pathway protein D